MRFVFTPPAEEAAGLLSLPWGEPLESWQDDRLVEIRQRGISRHVVRFVVDDGVLYALKELGERFARREYRLLRMLAELGVPAVEVIGVAVDRVKTRVAETGLHSRQLFLRTGIDAGENQARRLLNDIASFRAYLEQKAGRPISDFVAANRWREEVYEPVADAIPGDLRGRLAPTEIFHEILEHRWYMSEAAGRDVGTTAAARSYFKRILPEAPEPMETTTIAAAPNGAAAQPLEAETSSE